MRRISARGFLVLCGLWIIAIPLLMVALSVALPPLRNPLFLGIGLLVGFLLSRRLWLIRRGAGL